MKTPIPPMTEAERLATVDTGRTFAAMWITTHGLQAAEQRLASVRIGNPTDAAFFCGFREVVLAAKTTTTGSPA